MIAMSSRRRGFISTAMVALAVVASCRSPDHAVGHLPLRPVTDVALPGGSSRFDYQDVDPGLRRLFVAHLGAGRIDVLDLDGVRLVGGVTGVADVHGVRAAPDMARVFATATGTDEVVTIDARSLTVLARAPTGRFPDGLAYDPVDHKVFVSDEVGGDETVIDARTGQALGRIPLGGQAGNVAYDTAGRRVLVDVQTAGDLAIIDPTVAGAGRVTQRVHLAGCRENHGLQIDATSRLAYVACVGDARLLVVDLDTLAVVGWAAVGRDPDVLALDDGLRRLYVAAESGVVAVFAVDDRRLRPLGRARLAARAHSVAVDPTSHRVFFPLQNVGGQPVLRVMAPG